MLLLWCDIPAIKQRQTIITLPLGYRLDFRRSYSSSRRRGAWAHIPNSGWKSSLLWDQSVYAIYCTVAGRAWSLSRVNLNESLSTKFTYRYLRRKNYQSQRKTLTLPRYCTRVWFLCLAFSRLESYPCCSSCSKAATCWQTWAESGVLMRIRQHTRWSSLRRCFVRGHIQRSRCWDLSG